MIIINFLNYIKNHLFKFLICIKLFKNLLIYSCMKIYIYISYNIIRSKNTPKIILDLLILIMLMLEDKSK